jgi:RNA polymerase-binding transcription factor DksA
MLASTFKRQVVYMPAKSVVMSLGETPALIRWTVGDIDSGYSADPLDQAQEYTARFHQFANDQHILKRLVQAERAHERAKQGLGGICEGCGRTISPARMQCQPNTTRCMDCQRIYENQTCCQPF